MFYNTKEEAVAALAKHGAKAQKLVKSNPGPGRNLIPDPEGSTYYTTEGGHKGEGVLNFDDENVIGAFLLDYYGGCGQIFSFDLVEITPGVPQFGWDLD